MQYLFITNPKACRENGGHGVEFQEIMHNINSMTGLNISVYHSFHDEVAFYRKHIWRCNGPCQNKPPYYGYVKRAMNRAPGPKDPWWSQHEKECGGTYIKIDGPEFRKEEKKTPEENKENNPDKKKLRRKRTDDNQATLNKYFKKTKTVSRENTQEDLDLDRPRVYLYLHNPKTKPEKSDIKEIKEIRSDDENSQSIFSDSNSKSRSFNFFETTEKSEQTQTAIPSNTQKKPSPIKTGNVHDFMQRILKGKTENSNDGNINKDPTIRKGTGDSKGSVPKTPNVFDMMKWLESSPSSQSQRTPEKTEKQVEPSGFISADKLIKEIEWKTPEKQQVPSSNQEGLVYGFVISRENHPYIQNFWVRILINNKRTLQDLIYISDLASPLNSKEDREITLKGDIINDLEKPLFELNLKQGEFLEDEINDITIRLEKIFSSYQASNVKVLQAKNVPVCIGATFFDTEGKMVEDNKSKMEELSKKLLESF
jgi:SprT-like family.